MTSHSVPGTARPSEVSMIAPIESATTLGLSQAMADLPRYSTEGQSALDDRQWREDSDLRGLTVIALHLHQRRLGDTALRQL